MSPAHASAAQPLARPEPAEAPARRPAPHVAVCIATFRRPTGLRRLLDSLAALEVPSGMDAPLVIVVDNDAAGSSQPVVAAARAELPFELVYGVEPERNIALARNRGVSMALERGAAWLAFVDDDETVHPGWLRELLDTRDRLRADVVAGAVHTRCPADAPGWLAQDRFYAPRGARQDAVLTGAYTGNVLVRATLLAGPRGPFDARYGLSGGSDSHLFMRLHRGGARIVYAGRAVTTEVVPPARVRPAWVLRRAYRIGNIAVFCERDLPAGASSTRIAKAALRLGLGLASLPLGLLGGRGVGLRALWNVAYGCGAMAGAVGIRYYEYARPQTEE
ncbi:glycosyltransferase family 2 protein [Longimicrobium sp.]|uniref:glycosyltransferase family 2 protein n=1 Tax=Longimicrobium sp. TaxID=2029185 RepID=UPI002E37ABB0|nr:glycosyltransferase [Longimicrobium sp.]HEX6037001.1 glycosyltransferase [Longimicrobium sp.]